MPGGSIMRMAVRLFAGFILVLAEISAAAAEKRVALVIGNSSYEHVPERSPIPATTPPTWPPC
ncbi:MAG: hypothetical protein WBW51_01150 [Methyloceanibacter sp.]